MKSKQKIKDLKGSLKKRNYKAFFFFIGFTLLIWLFVQMSKRYHHDVEIDVLVDKPPQSLVFERNRQTFKVKVEQSGFKILGMQLFNSTMDIKFEELDSSAHYFTYNLQKYKSEIAQSLKLNTDDISLSQDDIKFSYYVLSTRKLEIKPNININFSVGYDSIMDFRFTPNYIEVSGNDSILKSLSHISTEEVNITDVSDSISRPINIKKIDSLSINYHTETINFFLPVAKFTEGVFEIPIEFQDPNLAEKLIIFPKTVKVNFKTSLSNYEKIDDSGFKVIAKYKPNENFMWLELVKKPKFVKQVSLENYKVDYLIKK